MPAFNYVRQALTLDGFDAYCRAYDFGKVPPDYIVLHHTANPSASYATGGLSEDKWWDGNERGLNDDQIKQKRLKRLDATKNYYQNNLGWSAGPHLFIDDRYVYLMTPMYDVGIHASFGNSFKRNGVLHYGIGIEVVGNFSKVVWPESVQHMVRGAVQILHQRLGTFGLDYMYADGMLPGAVQTADGYKARYPGRLRYGGLSSHRDYNKPSCPGDAITNAFYLQVIRGEDRPDYRYAKGATLRVNPSREASALRLYVQTGDVVDVVDTVQGESVNGDATWYKVRIGTGFAYVHNSGVTR